MSTTAAGRAMALSFVAIFAALVLTGCGDSAVGYRNYTGNGRGMTELQMDGAACDQGADYAYRSQLAAGPNSNASLATANVGTAFIAKGNSFEQCMNAHGWQKAQ
jgi:hypothetical protein